MDLDDAARLDGLRAIVSHVWETESFVFVFCDLQLYQLYQSCHLYQSYQLYESYQLEC